MGTVNAHIFFIEMPKRSLRTVLSIKLLSLPEPPNEHHNEELVKEPPNEHHNEELVKEPPNEHHNEELVKEFVGEEHHNEELVKEFVGEEHHNEELVKEFVGEEPPNEHHNKEDIATKVVKSVDDDMDAYTDGQDENADRSASTEVEEMLTGGSDLCGMIEKILEGGYKENAFRDSDIGASTDVESSDDDYNYDVEEEFLRQINGGSVSTEAPFVGGYKQAPHTYSVINAYPYVLKTKATSV